MVAAESAHADGNLQLICILTPFWMHSCTEADDPLKE